jgi:cation diffusion facilitator CzcD-associated flavoprotein CzcO
MFGGFNDITVSREANEAACDFVRRKIDQMVKDPEKARKLKPHDVYARRPLCDGNASNGQSYYEQFNRANVDIVSLEETPITRFEEKGIRTSDGRLYELDLVVFATGFDAVEGNYTRIDIHGKGGKTLTEAWEELGGPTSYLGCTMPGFPNFFMITGPKGPFTNIVPAIERQVEFVSGLIECAEKEKETNGLPVIEAKAQAEQDYSVLCDELAASSLFWSAQDNWIFGANVPGKKRSLRFYFGGMKSYLARLAEEVANGYPGFERFR